jgi:hypothetical protein
MRKDKHPLFTVWKSMRQRCSNPNMPSYFRYGERGISVCPQWADFWQFVADMGPRPDGTSLDRIDNDGNYEPSNCRWATKQQQQRNQRRAVYVTIEGEQYRAIELAEQTGLKTDTIVARAAKGMTYADVVRPERHVFVEGLAKGGKASGAVKQARTHCSKGHEFTAENTYITKEGWRNCRACHAAKVRRQTERKRAA